MNVSFINMFTDGPPISFRQQ